jgi:ribosome-associated protein
MTTNQRPPRQREREREPKGPSRPILRSSHGAPGKVSPRALPQPLPVGRNVESRGNEAAQANVPNVPSVIVVPNMPNHVAAAKRAKTAPSAVSMASDESREIAMAIATEAIEKKASGLEVIDVAGRVDYADFLVLMSGRSDRHVAALSSAIEQALRKRNRRVLAVEGLPYANWVLMDFGDVIVHVFQDGARATYDIDALWIDARRIPVPAP